MGLELSGPQTALANLAASFDSCFKFYCPASLKKPLAESKAIFRSAPSLPEPHYGEEYKTRAIDLIHLTRRIWELQEKNIAYTGAIITQACANTSAWMHDKKITALWKQYAELIADYLSDHPDSSKRVATLLLDKNGALISFGTNIMPVGLPLNLINHDKGERTWTRICSEVIAIARCIGKEEILSTPPMIDWRHAQREAEQHRLNIRQTAKEIGQRQSDAWLFSTVSPCNGCEDTLLAHGFKGVIAPSQGGEDFIRYPEIVASRERLKRKMDFIELQTLVFV